MTYTLFLDDERDPVDPNSVVCRSYEEAVLAVTFMGIPDHIDFDHDLGYGRTGHDFAKWLVNRAIDGDGHMPKTYAVHSQNHIGAENIRSTMDSYYRYINGETA